MAATTSNINLQYRGYLWSTYSAGSNSIPKGVFVTLASNTAISAADTNGHRFIGIARNTKDDDNLIDVFSMGTFLVTQDGSFTSASNTGDSVYILDNQTVTNATTSTNQILCGTITEYISATQVAISFNASALLTSGATSLTTQDVAWTTDENGDASVATSDSISGLIKKVKIIPDSDVSNEFDVVINDDDTDDILATEGKDRTNLANSIFYFDPSYAISDILTTVISNGGNTKSGTVRFYYLSMN